MLVGRKGINQKIFQSAYIIARIYYLVKGGGVLKYYGSKISDNLAKTPEDFLICRNVPIARIGVQEYLGSEIGEDTRAGELFKVYRLADDVFKPSALASFEGKPMTDDHPPQEVDPDNVRKYIIGTATNIRRGQGADADKVIADLIVYNQEQIKLIESGEKREISCGYECDIEPYKDGFKQFNIIGNHIALVDAGRAGETVAIRDEKKGLKGMSEVIKKPESEGYKMPKRHKSTGDFLKAIGLKMVARDSEPEDILEAVESLIEEKQAPLEEDPEPKVDIIKDIGELKNEIAALRDAITAMGEVEEMDTCKKDEDGTEIIEELIEELTTDAEESEVIEAEETKDEEVEEVETKTTAVDSAIELVKAIKPLIAALPDAKQRKSVSDSISKAIKKQVKDAKAEEARAAKAKADSSVYSKLINADSEPMPEYVDYGMEIAKKYNPHYIETKGVQ